MRTRIPGVQNPHWSAPHTANASASRARSASSNPSSVVTLRPATLLSETWHDTCALPSMMTVQHPHWPVGEQPSLGEVTSVVAERREEMGMVVAHGDGAPVHVECRGHAPIVNRFQHFVNLHAGSLPGPWRSTGRSEDPGRRGDAGRVGLPISDLWGGRT